MFLGKYTWNGKLYGLPGSFVLLVKRMYNAVADKLTTYIVKNNLEKCGKNVCIQKGFVYRYPSNIIIGNNVQIGRDVTFGGELSTGELIIEDNVVIGRRCNIDLSGRIVIQSGSLLSEGVLIQTHDHGTDPRCRPVGKSLIIGKNVWIGMYSTVLSNTSSIGDNVIIAANAVVTRPIEENTICGGIPAKEIKKLNKNIVI